MKYEQAMSQENKKKNSYRKINPKAFLNKVTDFCETKKKMLDRIIIIIMLPIKCKKKKKI